MANRKSSNRKSLNRKLLYHLLPVVFWLLAIGGSVLPLLPIFNFHFSIFNYTIGYLLAVPVLLCFFIVSRIKRHTNSIEECFVVALLLGIAAYWLPTVILIILPVWGYLIYRNVFSLKSFLASLIGFATVAIWIFVFFQFSIFNFQFSITRNLCAWLPLGAILIAWLASAITRNILEER